MPGPQKAFPFSVLAVPLLALLLFGAHAFRLVDFHEGDAVDLRFRLRGVQKADPRITLVVIDDQSVKIFGQWPWPRSTHAVFLKIISRYNPRMIFFDVLFTEAGPKPEDDILFARTLQDAGNVILPFFYQSLAPFRAQFPLKLFLKAAKNTAFVNALEDEDGHMRKAKACAAAGKRIFYSPAILMAAQEKGPFLKGLPLDPQKNIWINFPGPLQSFRIVSYAEVISLAGKDEDRLQDLFQDRFVLVGHAATGTTDLKPTSFSTQTPGVVVHAGLLHTLLTRRYLRALPEYAHLLLLLVLACASAWLFKKLNPAIGFAAMLAVQAAYFLANLLVFVRSGWILPLVVPLSALLITYIAALFMKYAEIYLQKEMSQRELDMAARIQEQFLPQTKPQSQFLEIAFETRFTKQVGGDLYDWADLGGGRFGFCVGDVSGKGMPAAIYMAKTLSDFRSISKPGRTPGGVCSELNRILVESPASGMFLTLLYAVADPSQKKLSYASAGHEFALLFRKKSKSTEILKGAQGMPLGMFEAVYETSETIFEEGDAVLFYSDGVKELRDPRGREWGAEALQKAFEQALNQNRSCPEIVQSLFGVMQKYQGNSAAHDDRTLLCVRYL